MKQAEKPEKRAVWKDQEIIGYVTISYRDRNFLNDMMSGCYIGFTEEECTLFHEKNMTELTELGYIS